jgi:hypothetical protein
MQVTNSAPGGENSHRWCVSSLPRLAAAAMLVAVLVNPASAAEDRELVVYTGFRDGGSFKDAVTGKSVSIQSSQVFAASLDFPLDEVSQFQIFYSFQDSSLGLDSFAAGAPIDPEFPLHVMYLQLGGTSFFTGEIGHGAYVVGGLGATLFDPTSGGYDSEMRLSANVGLGYEQPLGKRIALRFEARGYFTLINSSGSMFCSGGCAISISGDGVVQGELSIGLAFRI